MDKTRLVGCLRRGHEEDKSLVADFLIENLAAKASAVLALRHLCNTATDTPPENIDYLLGCGEEAIGDRYNRGGGNLAKAVGEMCGCLNATGSDVKAFCCAPNHAIIVGGALIKSGVFENVAMVAGGSFAKLGMKYRGHVTHEMPVLEDVLASIAILLGPDDGENPHVRLDMIGKHNISSGTSNQAITQAVVIDPLKKHGLKITDIDVRPPSCTTRRSPSPRAAATHPGPTTGCWAAWRSRSRRLRPRNWTSSSMNTVCSASPRPRAHSLGSSFPGPRPGDDHVWRYQPGHVLRQGEPVPGPHDPALRRYIIHDGTQRRPVTCIQV